MASTRKLLQEIEKTLKRVAEGLNEVRGVRVCRARRVVRCRELAVGLVTSPR